MNFKSFLLLLEDTVDKDTLIVNIRKSIYGLVRLNQPHIEKKINALMKRYIEMDVDDLGDESGIDRALYTLTPSNLQAMLVKVKSMVDHDVDQMHAKRRLQQLQKKGPTLH